MAHDSKAASASNTTLTKTLTLVDNPNHDYIIKDSPTDTVSCLDWAYVQHHHWLAASSWNHQLFLWQTSSASNSVQCSFTGTVTHPQPILALCFIPDGLQVAHGSADGQVQLWRPAVDSKTCSLVGKHANGVKEVRWCDQHHAIVSGSWDKTICYWDMRAAASTSHSQLVLPLSERVYGLDVVGHLLVTALADRQVALYDVRQPKQPAFQYECPLKHQLRCTALFPDHSAFAVGSVEGRVHVGCTTLGHTRNNFTFKCHREGPDGKQAFAVNALAMNFKHGTFASAGSDGRCAFWDKDSKQRLKLFSTMPQSITSCKFSQDGNSFAYATGYDWSKGVDHWDKSKKPQILIHSVLDSEIAPRNITSQD